MKGADARGMAGAAVAAVALSACSLFVDTDGLRQDPAPAGGGTPEAGSDPPRATAPPATDAGDASSPGIDAAAACGMAPGAWTVDGHCYFLLGKDTQPRAKAACAAAKAHLVTITSADEHQAMRAYLDDTVWIGLEAPPGTKDTNKFAWITGEPRTVDYWSVADDGTGCVAFDPGGHEWVDRPCDDSYRALCERP